MKAVYLGEQLFGFFPLSAWASNYPRLLVYFRRGNNYLLLLPLFPWASNYLCLLVYPRGGGGITIPVTSVCSITLVLDL